MRDQIRSQKYWHKCFIETEDIDLKIKEEISLRKPKNKWGETLSIESMDLTSD